MDQYNKYTFVLLILFILNVINCNSNKTVINEDSEINKYKRTLNMLRNSKVVKDFAKSEGEVEINNSICISRELVIVDAVVFINKIFDNDYYNFSDSIKQLKKDSIRSSFIQKQKLSSQILPGLENLTENLNCRLKIFFSPLVDNTLFGLIYADEGPKLNQKLIDLNASSFLIFMIIFKENDIDNVYFEVATH
jgi:hypothetical protein